MIKYSAQHEWIKLDGDVGYIGISDYAQQQLGDIVFVELPAVGKTLTQNQEAAVVESVKAASDVYCPVSGIVVETNERLKTSPELVNSAPETDGWFFKIRLNDASELDGLLDEDAYKKHIGA